MSGPATGRRSRVTALRAALACLGLIAPETHAGAQTLTPDLLRPMRYGFVQPQDSPLRRTSDGADGTGDQLRGKHVRAPSRIGNIPTYGVPAASGAAASGFDSLNRTRKKPKFYPGQVKPKPPPGPGSPPPVLRTGPVRLSIPPSESANKAPLAPSMAGT